MTFKRVTFFFVLLFIILLPFIAYKSIWIARSRKAIGFVTQNQEEQHATILFISGTDSIWLNVNNNIQIKKGEKVTVRYQAYNAKDARIDVFVTMWGDTLIYGGIPVLILIVIFLDHKIIPFGSRIRLQTTKPFLRIIP